MIESVGIASHCALACNSERPRTSLNVVGSLLKNDPYNGENMFIARLLILIDDGRFYAIATKHRFQSSNSWCDLVNEILEISNLELLLRIYLKIAYNDDPTPSGAIVKFKDYFIYLFILQYVNCQYRWNYLKKNFMSVSLFILNNFV